MEGEIDAKAQLDYIEFQIFPTQNRFDACVCYENKLERTASGVLEHLVLHSAEVKSLHAQGSNATYKLKQPENADDTKWFTKSTLTRFLRIIGSSSIPSITTSVKNEISQLEETREFHLSLYSKATQNPVDSTESEINYSDGGDVSSDASKNELLRAMDLRLTALRGEFTAAFDQAIGSACSVEEIIDIEKFSDHFGSMDLRESLPKYIELRRKYGTTNCPSDKHCSGHERVRVKEENNHVVKSSYSETPVKYGVSPAKVAEMERQSSSEGEESSYSSEEDEDRPSMERSRTLIRSASPRRSASPMRRIQIGRSGPRRSTAITIKSLNYFPARDRSYSHKDPAANNSDDEGSEQAPKRSEINATRMSVQDAINLFERKQRDQAVDIQKAKSLLNASVSANKSVLRRWSAGMGESSPQCSQDTVSDCHVPKITNDLQDRETMMDLPKAKPESDVSSNQCLAGDEQEASKPISPERAVSPVVVQEQSRVELSEKLIATAEWRSQKEAELNQLLAKMMKTNPRRSPSMASDSSKSQNSSSKQRGGLYNHYKEKRDQKLQGEATGKRTEKEKQFKQMQQILDARKAEIASGNASDAGRRSNTKKLQKSQKDVAQPLKPKVENAKPSLLKKAPGKRSLPATRKSWPSAPSPKDVGSSPAKTPPGTASGGSVPTRRRSQPTPPASRISPRVEKPQLEPKSVKPNRSDKTKSVKSLNEKKQQIVSKTTKASKTKVQTGFEDRPSSEKSSFHGKGNKKSSVVPIETKPFLRKGSGIGSGVNPVAKSKASTQNQEALRNSVDLVPAVDNEMVSNSSNPVSKHHEGDLGELGDHPDMKPEVQARSPEKSEGLERSNQASLNNDASFVSTAELTPKDDVEEELAISPTAWVEKEEQEDQPVLCGDGICEIESPANSVPVGVRSPRVRHSLSQMLLEESSEPDIIDWGNAENPPAMVYQKDAPKGLKRLLKFARKSKTDSNTTGWSSPSVFSEGEDDLLEDKIASKKSADNLLKKATLHSKNNGHTSAAGEYPGQSNMSNFSAQSLSQKLQEGNVSASVTTTKATRSFFSLSAFKGGK